jgi:SAM-dependent methyltransferase
MIDHPNGITREHVQWAYRTFLDREPESEEAIAAHMVAADLEALARRFIASREFRQKLLQHDQIVSVDAAGNSVEVDVDADALALLVAHVRRCWEFLGQERPHYSVLTSPSFLPDALQENEVAFWASGEKHADVLIRILARCGVLSIDSLTCIDFGCGVGRVTAPLANRFAAVHPYDISAPHLEIAKSRTRKANFHLLRELPVKLVPADVFYSSIVLQHNPPPIIAMLIKNALACLKPGGIAVFQVPTYEVGYSFSVRAYLQKIDRSPPPGMEMHCLPQHHIFRFAAEACCRVIEVREDNSTGRRGRDISNVFIIQRPSARESA